ncbi:ATP-binding protein [Paenibacillus sp. WC2504]|uniref:ATP-binding protein n=1 Tax=Paenibacillus sp. WC2504 TaxID=3461403 RepID=UPI004045AC86
MTFYKINEVDFSEEKESYFVFQVQQELEVKLNSGFSTAREILECLHTQLKQDKNVFIQIEYRNEQLSYFLLSEEQGFQQILESCTTRCNWIKEQMEVDVAFAKEKVTLRGCASPLVLKDRDENLIDELIRLSNHESFLIQVKLSVAGSEQMSQQMALLEGQINRISKEAEKQVGEQGHFGENFMKMIVGGENLSYQLTNVTAKQQQEILENHLYTLNSQGSIFSSAVFNIYGGKNTASAIAAHMEQFSKRSGSLSLYRLRKESQFSHDYLNFASVNNIAALLALPMRATPGLKRTIRVPFGAEVTESKDNQVGLGRLMTSYQTNVPVNIPLKDLTSHIFVSGVTGSGKTSTVKSLLTQAFQKKVPFLVLEPAKTEYKYLDIQIPVLQRFTLGIEGSHSFKINPFEFPEHIHVQTHLDHLKSVFVAAFPMYGPMPYILETAFYQIYRRSGWDFISGINIYETDLERSELFPTLEDLYLAIDQAIESVGYSTDLASDIRGALKVRIGSLLSGAKGTMLNTRKGHSIHNLLQGPAIMELEYIGDDQEKVFLMGLLLIAIYEHYISLGEHSGSLKHLLVIEEAHRLLENTRPSGNQENADMKGKAVETFNNLLSEIRTYGQGLVIADQIPTKLSPDIIKNTNLKIIHRLYALDDRQVVGDSMGLDEDQMSELLRLKQGEAVLFHGRIDSPIKVKVGVDSLILAEEQPERKRVARSPIVVEQYLLQEMAFRKACYKLIHTYLVYPEIAQKLNAELERNIASVVPNISMSPDKITRLWARAIEHYYNDHRLFEAVAHPQSIALLKGLGGSQDPLYYFFETLGTLNAGEHAKHKMSRYSKVYKSFSLFRKLLLYKDQKLVQLVAEHKNEFHFDNAMMTHLILKLSETGDKIRCDLLNFQQRQDLTSAIVLNEFGDNLALLESYFHVRTIPIIS